MGIALPMVVAMLAAARRLDAQGAHKSAESQTFDTLRMERPAYLGVVETVTGISAVGDGIVVLDRDASPHLLWIDAKSGRVLSKMGADGTLPGELASPACLQPVPGAADRVFVTDMERRLLLEIALRPRSSRIAESYSWESLIARCAVRFDSLLLLEAAFPDRAFYHANTATGKLDPRALAPPPLPGEVPYNAKVVALDPTRARLAAAYEFANVIEAFDGHGKRRWSVHGPVHIDERVDIAYLAVTATERYIYAGFCGCDPTRANREVAATELHVFTWDGRLVARIPVDSGLNAFAVAGDDSVLYASYGADRANRLGVWLLPAALRASGAPHK
ncbi:MAG: hypothetical protein ACYCVE_04110 [Gemmatimonadaceae bacterium]